MAKEKGRDSWKTLRRIAALAQAAAVVGLPFVTVGGESALRFDVPEMKLFFFGTVLFVDEFSLVLLAVLLLLVLAVGVTAILGRVWCGWICGQTVLPLLADWAASPLPRRYRRIGRDLLLLPMTALVSFSLLCYFVAPAEASRNVFLSPVLLGFFLAPWAVLYSLLVLLGPRLCRSVCPYAMLQNVLFDRKTLTIAFDDERSAACPRCELCVKVCPVGVDIKRGPQRECVACAECVDACVAMTLPRRIEPFIAYRGTVLRGKTCLFAGASAALLIAFLAFLHQRPGAALSLRWEGTAHAMSEQGQAPGNPGADGSGARAVNRYGYTVRNTLGRPLTLALRVEGNATLIGARTIAVPPRSRTFARVMLRAGAGGTDRVTFILSGDGIDLSARAAFP